MRVPPLLCCILYTAALFAHEVFDAPYDLDTATQAADLSNSVVYTAVLFQEYT